MGRGTYYSPLWVGTLVAAVAYYSNWEQIPIASPRSRLAVGALVCPLVGLLCQLAFLGVQGVSARVLPVPWGRSARGRPAAVTGWLVLATLTAGVVAAMFAWEGQTRPAVACGLISAALAAAALIAYLWCWPVATRDFEEHAG